MSLLLAGFEVCWRAMLGMPLLLPRWLLLAMVSFVLDWQKICIYVTFYLSFDKLNKLRLNIEYKHYLYACGIDLCILSLVYAFQCYDLNTKWSLCSAMDLCVFCLLMLSKALHALLVNIRKRQCYLYKNSLKFAIYWCAWLERWKSRKKK